MHAGVKAAFSDHDVKTVTEIGWRSSKDGPLLAFAQEEFDVFITIDRSLVHQQNVHKFKIGFVIVRVPRNELACYLPLFDKLKTAAESVVAGEAIFITSPALEPRTG